MIRLFCENCKENLKAKLNLRIEGREVIIECLECGAMQKLKTFDYRNFREAQE